MSFFLIEMDFEGKDVISIKDFSKTEIDYNTGKAKTQLSTI